MIIENDGFVGIGTTNPFSYLHVKGSAHDASGSGINNVPNLSDFHVMIVKIHMEPVMDLMVGKMDLQ